MLKHTINTIKEKSFVQEILKNFGEVYLVGGLPRDLILGVENKDIDLIVRKIPVDKLIEILEPFGKVDFVGKSFGVIKFLDNTDKLDYDIALPRTEKMNGEGGYRGFDIMSDENLPIEKDLERRDATINSIAIDINGNIIDPFNGLKDIENKILKATSIHSFYEDPLRVLRIVQFASRFGFKIEKNTWEEMKKNASKIKGISGERILIELEKIIKKGDPMIGFKLLMDSGVYDVIFGTHFTKFIGNVSLIPKSKTLSEFIYSIIQDSVKDISKIHTQRLKGTIDTAKEISALELAWENKNVSELNSRLIAFKLYKIIPSSFDLKLYPTNILKAISDLKSKYPKSVSDLQVDGSDLMELGLRGKEIAEAFNNILIQIYSDKLKNKKSDLINYLKSK